MAKVLLTSNIKEGYKKVTKTLRELRSCYKNHHTQKYIMENEIPMHKQEKIWDLVPSHNSGSFLFSDRCAFQRTTFIVLGQRLLNSSTTEFRAIYWV